MIKHNIRSYAFVILSVAFFTYTIIFLFTQNLSSIDFQKAITHISTTITFNVVLWGIFIQWAWKLRIFYPWLVQTPDLSGIWEGSFKSTWKENKNKKTPITVIIKQNFFNLHIKIITNESQSNSIGASFNIDKERGYNQLLYSYLNTPKAGVRERSEIHYGSAILNYEGFKVSKMEGNYWTDRKTTGEITLSKIK